MSLVIALDFDGVICDSIHECLHISYLAYQITENPALKLNDLLTTEISEPLKAKYYQRRGYVRPAKHFYLLWKWNSEFSDQQFDQTSFEALEAQYSQAVQQFNQNFYNTREIVREQNLSQWLEWQPLFEGVIDLWPRLKNHTLYIVTTKDSDSVQKILGAHNLEVKHIFGKDDFTNKAEALEKIGSLENVNASNIFYLDDHPEHLKDVSQVGVKPYWAGWGYSKPTDDIPNQRRLKRFMDILEFIN